MLQATIVRGAIPSLPGQLACVGCGLGADASVQQLQEALNAYRSASGFGLALDLTGTVDSKTIAAVVLLSSKVGAKIGLPIPAFVQTVFTIMGAVPSLAPAAIDLAMLNASTAKFVTDVREWIRSNAAKIAMGVRALTYLSGGGQAPSAPSGGMVLPSSIFKPIIIPTPAGGYPMGTIARFNKRRSVYSIYVPTRAGVSGLGQLPTTTPEGYMKAGEAPSPPAGVPVVGEEDDPWYKRASTWLILGGAVLVVGTGAYFIWRK